MGLFGTDVGHLEEPDVHLAQALAHVATIGLLQDRAIRRGEILSEQLQAALNSRVVIEQDSRPSQRPPPRRRSAGSP